MTGKALLPTLITICWGLSISNGFADLCGNDSRYQLTHGGVEWGKFVRDYGDEIARKAIASTLQVEAFVPQGISHCSGVAVSPEYLLVDGHCVLELPGSMGIYLVKQGGALLPQRILLQPVEGFDDARGDLYLLRRSNGEFRDFAELDFGEFPSLVHPRDRFFFLGYPLVGHILLADSQYARHPVQYLVEHQFNQGNVQENQDLYASPIEGPIVMETQDKIHLDVSQSTSRAFIEFGERFYGIDDVRFEPTVKAEQLAFCSDVYTGNSGSPIFRVRDHHLAVVGLVDWCEGYDVAQGVISSAATPLYVLKQVLQREQPDLLSQLTYPTRANPVSAVTTMNVSQGPTDNFADASQFVQTLCRKATNTYGEGRDCVNYFSDLNLVSQNSIQVAYEICTQFNAGILGAQWGRGYSCFNEAVRWITPMSGPAALCRDDSFFKYQGFECLKSLFANSLR